MTPPRQLVLPLPERVSLERDDYFVSASNRPALTAHVVAAADEDTDVLRRQLAVLLHQRFSIGHATLQMEGDHCGDVGHCSGHDHHHDHEGHRH